MPDERAPRSYTSFLGTGWSFPPEFVRDAGVAGSGQVLMTSDEEDIRASLNVLFATAEGERFLRPGYGLRLDDQVFEPMSTTARTYLKDRIRNAILIYEPRIALESLELDTSRETEGVIAIVLDYVVRATNSRFNLVHPFYTSDANELQGRRLLPVARRASAA